MKATVCIFFKMVKMFPTSGIFLPKLALFLSCCLFLKKSDSGLHAQKYALTFQRKSGSHYKYQQYDEKGALWSLFYEKPSRPRLNERFLRFSC